MVLFTERVLRKRESEVEVVVLSGRVHDDALEALAAPRLHGGRVNAGVAERRLELAGYELELDVRVESRGDGRRGRVATVARRGDETLAIEWSDRRKNRTKLFGVEDATARVIVRPA